MNATPSWGTIVGAQLRLVARLQRRDFAILGAIAAGLLALVLWGYMKMPSEFQSDGPEVLPVFPGLAYPLVFIAALWPLGVWRRDEPGRRGYFWSLPVARGPHTLIRVGAGWLLLMTVCAAVMALAVAVVMPASVRDPDVSISFAGAWIPLVIPTLPYVLVSVLAVAFENPLRFSAWVFAGFFAVFAATEVFDDLVVSRLFDSFIDSFGLAIARPTMVVFEEEPAFGGWIGHYLTWLAVGTGLLLLAAFRHRDSS
jgi:hypothetical protein